MSTQRINSFVVWQVFVSQLIICKYWFNNIQRVHVSAVFRCGSVRLRMCLCQRRVRERERKRKKKMSFTSKDFHGTIQWFLILLGFFFTTNLKRVHIHSFENRKSAYSQKTLPLTQWKTVTFDAILFILKLNGLSDFNEQTSLK